MVVHFPSEDPKREAHHDANRLFDEHRKTRDVHAALEGAHGHPAASDTIHRFDEQHVGYKRKDVEHNNVILSFKESLERLAFGVGNLQLLNVLLITVIPNFVLAGILLGVRSILSGLVESGYASFSASFEDEKQRSFWYGSGLGYAFILSAIFITLSSMGGVGRTVFTVLFAISFLAIGVFGALYLQSGLRLKGGAMNKDRMKHYLKWITYYGIVLVAGVFLAAGFILDLFADPLVLNVAGRPFLIYGYAVLLFATGILILITSYLATRMRRIRPLTQAVGSIGTFSKAVRASLRTTIAEGGFARSMLIAGVLFYSSQLALNYYLGIHLYEYFDAFTPVAMLFAATLVTTFVVPLFFDKKTLRLNGRSSLFMFGAGLTLFIPLSFYLVNLAPLRAFALERFLGAAPASAIALDFFPMLYLLIGIAGSSIAGIAFSRLALDTMRPQRRVEFMRSLGYLTPLVSGLLIMFLFAIREVSPAMPFAILSFVFLVVLVVFATLIANRLEQRFEQQALAPRKGLNEPVEARSA